MDNTKDKRTIREIDLIESAKTILNEPKLLIKFVGVGIVVGLIVAFATPKHYTSDVVLAPELSSGGLGMTGNLADMAASFGFDLGNPNNNMDAIYPEIYPEILGSTDFIRTLFPVPVKLKNDTVERTYFKHLVLDTKIPFWKYPQAWLAQLTTPKETAGTGGGKPNPLIISKNELDLCFIVSNSIDCSVDKKTSVITISVTDQDPLVAAIMADTIQRRLQNYITAYRTQKARTDFDYYTNLHAEAKADFKSAQSAYVEFCDLNKGVQLQKYIAKRNELENEMNTAFTLMNQMAIQVQTAKAKIQERTPAYTMVKSAKMPYKASSTSRLMILIVYIFLACLAAAAWILFIREPWHAWRKQRAEAKAMKIERYSEALETNTHSAETDSDSIETDSDSAETREEK